MGRKEKENQTKPHKPKSIHSKYNKPTSNTNTKNSNNKAGKKNDKEEYSQNFEEEKIFWYDEVPEIAEDSKINNDLTLEEQKNKGRLSLEKMLEHKGKQQSSDEKWMKLAASSGTTSDKMAASVLLVRSSPLAGLKTIDGLLAQSKKKGDKVNTVAVESLKELFLLDLLPDNRKLKFFREQPYNSSGATPRHLMFWYFEEELKLRFSSFVNTLEVCSKNTLPHIRDNAIKAMFDLLTKKPEQEKALLTILINKLGDIERKTASKVSFLLLVLLNEHPNMKFIVVREVELFLSRPNLSEKAKYYAVIFLNQIILLKRDEDVSVKLVEIYFNLFNQLLGKEDTTNNSRMLSALLTGLNRAFPFVPETSIDKFNDQISILFKIVHVTTFNKSIQALMLLFQLMVTKKKDISERYYKALYEKLLAPDLHTSSRIAMFFNVLFRSLKVDKNQDRVRAFIKRLLQVCTYEKPSFICGSLFIISEIFKHTPGLWSLLIKPEKKVTTEKKTTLEDTKTSTDPTNDDDDEDEEVESNSDPNRHTLSDDDEETNDFNLPSNLSLDKSNSKDESKQTPAPVLLPHEYDPLKRNPLYSNALNSCIWEISFFLRHYHPSVRAFAKTLQEKHYIDYRGDPLKDFGIISFLDKFVYKNPKKKDKIKGISIMQSYTPTEIKTPILVNSLQFAKQKESSVPVEDLFFYQYFKERDARNPRQEKEKKDEEGDDEDEDDNFDDDDEDDGLEGADLGDEGEASIFADDDDEDVQEDDNDDNDDGEGDDKLLFADSDSDDESGYSYNDLGEDDFEEDEGVDDGEEDGDGFNPSEAMLEKMLIEEAENEDDDDEDGDFDEVEDSNDDNKSKKSKGKKSTFVDADEFAYLLQDNTNPKQLEWEKKRLNAQFSGGKRKRSNSKSSKQSNKRKK